MRKDETYKKNEVVSEIVEVMGRVWDRTSAFAPIFWPNVKLTDAQLKILVLLGERERRVGDIATNLRVSMPSASRFVRSLINKGLVKRRPDDIDRRLIICSLTKAGKQIVSRLSTVRRKRIRAAVTLLDPPELDKVLDAMKLFDNVLSQGGQQKLTEPDE